LEFWNSKEVKYLDGISKENWSPLVVKMSSGEFLCSKSKIHIRERSRRGQLPWRKTNDTSLFFQV
jgi:hypothetical protein